MLRAQPDDRLLVLARDGDDRAFEALVERYRNALVAQARCLLPAARAEDAVQQGLLQAWLALQRGTDVRDVKPWLYRIVHNSAISLRRAVRDDHAPLTDTLAAPGTPHSDLEQQIAARDALAQVAALPRLQREVVLQTAVGERSRDQVATALGLSDGAVRGLLYRARTTMRSGAGALIPSPFVTWAMRLVSKGPPSAEPLLATRSITGAGIAAVLEKGGAVAVAIGVLAAGGPAVHSHLRRSDTPRPGNYGNSRAVAAQTARPRVDADRPRVARSGSTRPVVARSTATSAISHVSISMTSTTTRRWPAPKRPQLVESGSRAQGIGLSGTMAGDGLTSVSHSSSSGGSGSTDASLTPPRRSGSGAASSISTGGDSGHGKAGSESGGSESSATAPAAAGDTSRVSTGEGDPSVESSGNHSNTNVTSTGGDRSAPGASSETTETPSHVSDGGTTSERTTPTVPPTNTGSD